MRSDTASLESLKRAMADAVARDDFAGAGALIRSLAPASTDSAIPRARLPKISDLGREELLALIAELELVTVEAGAHIITEGEPGKSVYGIVHGQVEIVREHAPGGRHVLARLGPGEFFGEMSLVAAVPRLASVVATEPVGLFVLSGEQMTRLRKSFPRVQAVLATFYKERLLDELVVISPVLNALDVDGRRAAIDRFAVGSLPAGLPLLSEGEPGAGFYVLLRGRCAVEGTGPGGAPLTYPDLVEGDVFGEISLIHETPASATVRTSERSVVLALTRREFDEVVLASPAAREKILALVDERLARTHALSSGASADAQKRDVLLSRVI